MAHVVILGAGASRDAFPAGDKHGRLLPLMNDLAVDLDLMSLLRDTAHTSASVNFEALFSDLVEADPDSPLIPEIEGRVRAFFQRLELPDEATLYDRLILSLRPRDIIATFNWDPLLFQAYRRNRHLRKLPKMAALHGSVAIGGCSTHRQCGYADDVCPDCGEFYEELRLLYPVKRKNYQQDSFIAGEWDRVRRHMSRGYWLTVFGYSAPESDAEALELLTDMAAANTLRDDGDVEIIDIKDSHELYEKWSPFFVRSHFSIISDYGGSVLARHPRRATEALWLRTQELAPLAAAPFPDTNNLAELQRAAAELMIEPTENDAG
jgi:hypothetical protein